MGLFDALNKMIQGKPVFEVPDEDKRGWNGTHHRADDTDKDSQSSERIHRRQRFSTDTGQKIVPEVEFTGVEPRYSGKYVELWVTVRNISQYPVFLDKSDIFGMKQELDYPLSPGGQREFRVYRGERRRDNSYKYAELYYRDEGSGDYFCAAHMIEYRHESDGSYDIVGLDLIRPIKDI